MALGWLEIAVIILVIILIFGVSSIPKLGKAVGDGLREFKNASRGDGEEEKEEKNTPDKPEGGG